MVTSQNDTLFFSFPEVHEDAKCSIRFQRTLRIPDDNREYPLPPGLGAFPLAHVEDYAEKLPQSWGEHGGVLLPMYQSEALWINFNSPSDYPFAVKIAVGKINAVTGKQWKNTLDADEQDYIVLPDQPWLDGICIQKGIIRQFVAMPLGGGYTVEEQITGQAEHGGLQILVYPVKKHVYDTIKRVESECRKVACIACASMAMGLAPGGMMRQEIYEDKYGYDAWEQSVSSRTFVHILNSEQWHSVTGKEVPTQPASTEAYTNAGLPWFEYYGEAPALNGSSILAGLDSVAAKMVKQGKPPMAGNAAVNPTNIEKLSSRLRKVINGMW